MRILVLASITLVLVPIFFYINTFGFGLWNEHTKWAELGSFFGGVLGPIITVISVGFLFIQLKTNNKQQQHTIDTLKLQKVEADIAFFLPIVKADLARKIPTMDNKVLSESLSFHAAEFCSVHTHYQGNDNPDLIVKEFGKRSFDFLICYEGLFASWLTINSHLHTLKELDFTLNMDSYKSQRARVFTSLDSVICSHMDTISMLLDKEFMPHFRCSFESARDEVQSSLKQRT